MTSRLRGCLAAGTAVGGLLVFGVAAAAATDVLTQGWENTSGPYGGLLSDLPAPATCGLAPLAQCHWTRTTNGVASTVLDATANASPHDFWHIQDNPQTIGIKHPDINPNLVTLAVGDSGELPSAFSGTHVAWFGEPATGTFCGSDFAALSDNQVAKNGCNSTDVQEGELVSPPFSLVGVTSAIMHFEAWWEIESVEPDRSDLMYVEDSTDGGTTWNAVGLLNPANNPAGGHDQSAGQVSGPTWQEYLVDLSRAIGATSVQVRFRFDTHDVFYQGFRGWLIDAIRVTAPFDVPPPAITSVDTCPRNGFWTVTVIRGTNFILGSSVKLDGVAAPTARTPSSDRIEIPAASAAVPALSVGTHTLQVIDPNGTISSPVFTVDKPASCTLPGGPIPPPAGPIPPPAGPIPPPAGPIPPPANLNPPPNSTFVDGTEAVLRDRTLLFNEQFPEAGHVTAAAYDRGAELARMGASAAVKAKCEAGLVRTRKKCVRNGSTPYGSTTLNVPAAGSYQLRIPPSAAISRALLTGRTLHITTTITFYSARGGTPSSHVRSVRVGPIKKRRSKH